MIKAFHNTTLKTSEQIEASGFLYAAAELRRRGVPLAMRPSDEFPPDGNEFVYLYPECHQYSNDHLTFRGAEDKHNIVAYVFDAVDLIRNHNAIVSYDLFGIRDHEQLRDLSTEQLIKRGRLKRNSEGIYVLRRDKNRSRVRWLNDGLRMSTYQIQMNSSPNFWRKHLALLISESALCIRRNGDIWKKILPTCHN